MSLQSQGLDFSSCPLSYPLDHAASQKLNQLSKFKATLNVVSEVLQAAVWSFMLLFGPRPCCAAEGV